MIIDARRLPHGTILEADICIIGAGPGGISLAREFQGAPFRVILLEGGRMSHDGASQALYKGENVGVNYENLEKARSRYFGGASNCWGGFCRPMDPHDFEVRDWIPNSGWPIKRADLMPYYRRAHALLELGPFEYDPPTWESWIGRSDARLLPLERNRVINIISQLSPPTRFGQRYYDDITRSGNVTAYLDANVTEIEAPGTGSHVRGLQVRTLAGGSFRVTARTYVLATGGIETPRLLLASNRYQPAGVGNTHDCVGRYFMDHPRLRSGTIAFRDPKANNGIYDLHNAFAGRLAARGVKIGAYFGLTEQIQREERIGNTRCYAVPRFVGDDHVSYEAAERLRRAIRGAGSLLRSSPSDIIKLLRHLPNVAMMAVAARLRFPLFTGRFALETVVEPAPSPDSRVTLGTERDALGVPRVRVDWRVGELEKRTIRRAQEILAQELARTGTGDVVVDAPRDNEAWPDTLMGCWHHMGTARMHADPRQGVVDTNCRVHGMENLFIAGSSVFPTCGSDMPTITIVALALRLAEHIKANFAEVGGRVEPVRAA
jgi:choline dehydrogenase-like flavoprotein